MQFVIPVPSRVHFAYVLGFATVLFTAQLISGTDSAYAALIFLFLILAGSTVNSLGGLVTLNGFVVAVMALKVVVVSQVAKVLLWQPGDSYLEIPVVTAEVLVVGMTATYGAALLVRNIKFRAPLLQPTGNLRELKVIWAVSYLLGLGSHLYSQIFGFDATTGNINVGGAVGLARQIAFVYPLSIVAATAHTLISSDGRKSFGTLVAISVFTEAAIGLIATSKQGMFEPFLYYLLTCVAYRFPFRPRHAIAIAVAAAFAVTVLFPVAQVGRGFARTESFTENVSLVTELIADLDLVSLRLSLDEFAKENYRFQYYGEDMGLLDRMSLIEPVDELVLATVLDGPTGWTTITHGFERLPPRFLYPDKPVHNTANFLGHRIGILSTEDESTQIAFGIIAEAFSAFEWIGAAVIPFVLLLFFFVIYKRLVGEIDRNIWAVFLFGGFQHSFTENTISSMILFLTHFPILLLIYYLLVSKVAVGLYKRQFRTA